MKLYSLAEAAKYLGKSRQWLWFLIQMKKLTAEKVGNQYTITEDELKKYKAK